VQTGDVAVVERLLNLGIDLQGVTYHNEHLNKSLTALEFASLAGSPPLVRALLAGGARIDEPEREWNRSLIVLAIVGCSNKALFDKRRSGSSARTRLWIKSHPSVRGLESLVEELASRGARVNIPTSRLSLMGPPQSVISQRFRDLQRLIDSQGSFPTFGRMQVQEPGIGAIPS
jgi:hypothetical protein